MYRVPLLPSSVPIALDAAHLTWRLPTASPAPRLPCQSGPIAIHEPFHSVRQLTPLVLPDQGAKIPQSGLGCERQEKCSALELGAGICSGGLGDMVG